MIHLLVAPLKLLAFVIGYVANLIYAFIYEADKTDKKIPPITNVLLLDSASVLASKIRQKKVTSVEVVEAFIDRINQVNPNLNCIVDKRFEAALAEAAKVDRLIAEAKDVDKLAEEKPFLGVPFTTKDCFAVEGLSWTTGLHRRKGIKVSELTTVKSQFNEFNVKS